MNEPIVHTTRTDNLIDFLQLHGMEVEPVESTIYRVVRDGELPVFLNLGEECITFEVDLGCISEIKNEALLFELLDANTEIQPVSFAVDSTNPEDLRLLLTESRILGDLNDREILSVFDALELAADKAEKILASHLK